MDDYALTDQESDYGQVWLKSRLDIIIGYYVTKELIQQIKDRMSMLVRDNHDVLLDTNLD